MWLNRTIGNGRPRVMFVLDTPNLTSGVPLAGTPARLVYLAAALQEAGADITFILGDRGMTLAALRQWHFPGILVNPELLYGSPPLLLPHLRELRPSILVVSDAVTTATNARIWATELNALLVYEAHDDEAVLAAAHGEPPSVVRLRGQWQHAAACSADFVTVLSERERQFMIERGIASNRLLVAPNGANLTGRTAWGPDPAARRALFIGNLFYEPNALAVRTIIAIIGALRARGEDVEARIVGRGPRALMRPHPGIDFLGAVPDLDPVLHGVSIGLAPLSLGSGMKCKVIDYMAAALPVLATTEAVNGLPAGNPGIILCDDLALWPQLLGEMLAAPALLKLLGARGRVALHGGFSWSTIGKHVLRTYCEWLAAGPAAPLQPHVVLEGSGQPNWLIEHARKQGLGAPGLTAHQPVFVLPGTKGGASSYGKEN